MNTTLILKRFKDIGLSSNEAKSYVTLLERETLTVPEVSRLAGIPLPNAYRALERLMSKGLCIAKPGATKKYSASDPSLLEDRLLEELNTATQMQLENLRKKEEETLEKTHAAKEDIRAMIQELKPQYEKSQLETSPLDYIEIIKDPYQVHKRYMELVRGAKEEYLAIVKAPFTGPPEKLKEQIDLGVEVLKRGVTFRSIYEPPGDPDPIRWLTQFIERLAEHGAEVRILKSLPMKTAIFDSRIVLFALADPVSKELSLTSQVIEHPALAQSLKILFETLWAQAQDYHILKD